MNQVFKVFLLLFLTSLSLIGQTPVSDSISYNTLSKKTLTDSTQKRQRKVFFKPFYSIQSTYRSKQENQTTLSNSGWNSITSYTWNSHDEVYSIRSEYGLLIEIKMNPYLNLNTGLTIDNHGFTTKNTELHYKHIDLVHGGMHNFDTTFQNYKFTYKFQFLTVPLIVNYVFQKKKTSFYIGLGIEAKLLLSSSLEYEKHFPTQYYTDFSYSTHFENYRKQGLKGATTLFSVGNLGVSTKITKHVFAFIEPNLKYQIGEFEMLYKSPKVQLWSAGCRVGIKF